MRLNQLIYRVSRPFGGLQLARYLSRNHPKILMYHRISKDENGGGIPINQFRRQVEVIKKYFTPMTLKDLMRAHEAGDIPEHAVVVTFDDGYRDFADIAYPILQEAGVPVTLFITTGFVNGDLWLWPDKIRYAINKTTIKNVRFGEFNLSLDSEERKFDVWNEISDYCLSIGNQEKLDLIEKFFVSLGVDYPEDPPDEYKAITWDQLREMERTGLEVGSHSVSHPILTRLNEQQIQFELTQSRNSILGNIGKDPMFFCYPNGQSLDFDDRVKFLVEEAGYKYAVAAFQGVRPLDDRWVIKRYPASGNYPAFEKSIYGFSYLGMAF